MLQNGYSNCFSTVKNETGEASANVAKTGNSGVYIACLIERLEAIYSSNRPCTEKLFCMVLDLVPAYLLRKVSSKSVTYEWYNGHF